MYCKTCAAKVSFSYEYRDDLTVFNCSREEAKRMLGNGHLVVIYCGCEKVVLFRLRNKYTSSHHVLPYNTLRGCFNSAENYLREKVCRNA